MDLLAQLDLVSFVASHSHIVALQIDARIAKVNGALGSVKSAAALARSIQLTQGLAPNTSVVMEGVVITMVNGYPAAASITALYPARFDCEERTSIDWARVMRGIHSIARASSPAAA